MPTYLSHSLLLKENSALAAFCNKIRESHKLARQVPPARRKFSFARASIVCERKEDVLAVRSHVFSELKELCLGQDALSGVSTYTVDSLARSLVQWAMLAVRAASRRNLLRYLGTLSQEQLAKPYIDIVTQEKLVRHVLLNLGYKNPDALPLAKQILTLLDTQLPEDLSLIDLFLRSHDLNFKKSGLATAQGTRSMAYILCAFQASRELLSSQECMRLQNFLLQGLELAPEGQLEVLVDCLWPEIPALQTDLLWFEGPSYALITDHGAWNTFKECKVPSEIDSKSVVFEYQPGNFGSQFTNSLARYVGALRDILARKQRQSEVGVPPPDASLAITSRTYVSAPQFQEVQLSNEATSQTQKTPFQSFHFEEIVVCADLHEFLKTSQKVLAGLDQKDFPLLGDVTTEHSRVYCNNAAGRYSPCDDDLRRYFALKHFETQGQANTAPCLPLPALELLQSIEAECALYDEMLKKHEPMLANFLKNYGLQMGRTSPEERVRILAVEAEYMALNFTPRPGLLGAMFKDLPQALSFFPSNTLPSRWVVLGRPHSSKQASVNVRALNDVLFELIKRGVPLTVPASDFMYRIFWKSLFAASRPVVIVLQSEQDFEELVDSLGFTPSVGIVRKQPLQKPVGVQSANTVLTRFLTEGLYPGLDPDWMHKFKGQSVGVTAFEDYVNCPFQFYLKHVLKLDSQVKDLLAFDSLAAGTRTHRVLELLVTSINLAFQNTELNRASFVLNIAELLTEWMTALLKPEIFSASSADSWIEATAHTLERMNTRLSKAFPNFTSCSNMLLKTLPEVVTALFDKTAGDKNHAQPLKNDQFNEKLGIEAGKRFFIRFLHAEAERLRSDLKRNRVRVTSFVEHPVKLWLGKHLELHGTIDRIDSLFDLSTQKLLYQEIIDYKTSKPFTDPVTLALFPEQALQTKQKAREKTKEKADVHLSIQGGLYILAFAAENRQKELTRTPLAFSLLRLGSLNWATDPYVSVHIGENQEAEAEPANADAFNRELDEIRNQYACAADRLSAGYFEAAPRDESVCSFCLFQTYCPIGGDSPAAGDA